MNKLTEQDKSRYKRQLTIPGWDEAAQEKIKAASIGVAGAGGLGSAIITYLAAAGFGKITIADKDVVDLTNLNRQILHWQTDIGNRKVDSAAKKIKQLNPDIEIVPVFGEITEKTVSSIFSGTDIIIDALDNFASRNVVNQYSVDRGVPFVHGAVWGLEGRITTVIPGNTACFTCIYPATPPAEVTPVAGVTPGLIGMLQVTEAIKISTGIGELLSDVLLVCDFETMSFTRLHIRKNPDCPVCGHIQSRSPANI